jgi:hypothetical protein
MALVFHYRNLLIIGCSLHTDEQIHSQGLQEEANKNCSSVWQVKS